LVFGIPGRKGKENQPPLKQHSGEEKTQRRVEKKETLERKTKKAKLSTAGKKGDANRTGEI